MTIEICRFSWQDVFCDWKLTVLFLLVLLEISLMGCSFVCGNIASFRIWKMISRRELDWPPSLVDSQSFVARLLGADCVRRPLVKGLVCLLMALVTGFITMVYCVAFLSR